jgi:uncharacterized protein YndB with AHSA1/START domain
MTTHTVVHATTVVERNFKASPERVFNAWADPSLRAQWDLPGDDSWVLAELEQDFRVGGREKSRFGPKDNPNIWSSGTYLDIVMNARIISAGTMHVDERAISTTMCTIEFSPAGQGTRVLLTDQSAFLDGLETPRSRKSGWSEIFDKLALLLNEPSSAH